MRAVNNRLVFVCYIFQLNAEWVLVHRGASCLWFACVCHVVAQWADIINPAGSRASRVLWLTYTVVVSLYTSLVFVVTLVAVVWARDHTQTVLLDTPDIVRTVGEVASLIGFVVTGSRILARYLRLPSHFRSTLRHAVRSLAGVLTVCSVLFLLRWVFTLVAVVKTFDSSRADTLKVDVLIFQCGLGRLCCQIVAEWIPEIVSSLAIILLQWRERKHGATALEDVASESGSVYGSVEGSVPRSRSRSRGMRGRELGFATNRQA